MRLAFNLGHIHPVATHLLAFIVGFSSLFLVEAKSQLGLWQGIMVSLSNEKKVSHIEGSHLFIAKKVENELCLLNRDPLYLYRNPGDTTGIVFPRQRDQWPLIRMLISGRVKYIESPIGLELCEGLENRVSYG